MEKVNVLDKGFVRLIEVMGSDLTVVNAARVSFHKESSWDGEQHWTGSITGKTLPDKDKKLISYLAKHKHWTPFAHPQIMLHIKAPISIRTQLFKSKVGFVENEISRRYVTEEPEIYIPKWRTKPTNGAKQGSEDFLEEGVDYNMITTDYKRDCPRTGPVRSTPRDIYGVVLDGFSGRLRPCLQAAYRSSCSMGGTGIRKRYW